VANAGLESRDQAGRVEVDFEFWKQRKYSDIRHDGYCPRKAVLLF
jgi:hypothetical protein